MANSVNDLGYIPDVLRGTAHFLYNMQSDNCPGIEPSDEMFRALFSVLLYLAQDMEEQLEELRKAKQER